MFNSAEDAQKAAYELTSELKYHEAKVHIEEHKKYDKAGKPSPKSTFTLKYKFKLELVLIQDEIERKIKEDSFFVLVTCNDSSNLSAKEIIATYRYQYCVERTWRGTKAESLYVDAFFLKNPQRMRVLLFLQSLSLFVANYLLSLVHEFLAKYDLQLQVNKSYKTRTPSWNTLLHFIDEINPTLQCDFTTSQVSVDNVRNSLFLMKLTRFLGFTFSKFYDPLFYKCFIAHFEQQSIQFVTEDHQLYRIEALSQELAGAEAID